MRNLLYGLPKIHKHGIPLRPILSAIKYHSYSLAKFLVSLLRPLPTNPYTILLYILNLFFSAMLRTCLYCLTHVIILFLSVITLTQNIPTLNLLLKLKMMIKLCLFSISVLKTC